MILMISSLLRMMELTADELSHEQLHPCQHGNDLLKFHVPSVPLQPIS